MTPLLLLTQPSTELGAIVLLMTMAHRKLEGGHLGHKASSREGIGQEQREIKIMNKDLSQNPFQYKITVP